MLSGLRILVAEDNKLNQKIVNFILQKHHASVTIANNGHEAITLLQDHTYDLVLMDLQMPEMDGQAATVHIRQVMNNHVPIVALTASTLANETQECLDLGMNSCISKPFDPTGLCELILKITNEHKMILGKRTK